MNHFHPESKGKIQFAASKQQQQQQKAKAKIYLDVTWRLLWLNSVSLASKS